MGLLDSKLRRIALLKLADEIGLEIIEHLEDSLDDDLRIAFLKLRGAKCTYKKIAEVSDCSTATVGRQLRLIRMIWMEEEGA